MDDEFIDDDRAALFDDAGGEFTVTTNLRRLTNNERLNIAGEILEGGVLLSDNDQQILLANGIDLRYFHPSYMQ